MLELEMESPIDCVSWSAPPHKAPNPITCTEGDPVKPRFARMGCRQARRRFLGGGITAAISAGLGR